MNHNIAPATTYEGVYKHDKSLYQLESIQPK
jgi:hypothetical protein